MANNNNVGLTFRIIHRYLGFFLAGIMAVYSLSGIIMIFRDTDFLKQEKVITKQAPAGLNGEQIGEALRIRRFNITKQEGDLIYFDNGTYDQSTGEAKITIKALPAMVEKMTHLHKAKSGDTLFFLNIFFGLSLLFFVISAFWMFMPKTSVFKKGLYFTAGGVLLTLILLFI